MDQTEIRKNQLDLKYQNAHSLSLKFLSLAVTIFLAFFAIGVDQNNTDFYGQAGMFFLSILFIFSYIAYGQAQEYMNEIEMLSSRETCANPKFVDFMDEHDYIVT